MRGGAQQEVCNRVRGSDRGSASQHADLLDLRIPCIRFSSNLRKDADNCEAPCPRISGRMVTCAVGRNVGWVCWPR